MTNLLQSEIPEDIAIGLYHMEREGKLKRGDHKTNCKEVFTVEFDKYTVWIFDKNIYIRSLEGGDRFSSYDIMFDFRTKNEE